MFYLHGLGHFHPENEISNRFLEELDIGTDDEWIVSRTGIRSRRTVLDLDYIRNTRNRDVRAASEASTYTNAELAHRAAEQAIQRAGIDVAEIGMVIGGGSVPDHGTPAEACQIAALMDLEVPAIDIRSACTSFGATLWFLSRMKEEELPPYVLVVMAETVTRSVDYDDRRAAVLWGDAAVAAVVSTSVPGRAQILPRVLGSRPSGHGKVVVPWAHYFEQEGRAVQSYAIKTTARLLRELRDEFAEQANGSFHFVGHQANLRMLESVCRRCEVPGDRHLTNVVEFGNTATAGSPSVLSARWDDISAGDHVAVVGVGAGLTWTSTMLHFLS